jgi:hypothetical protein
MTLIPQQATLALIFLFRGVLFSEDHPIEWESLLTYQGSIRDYVAVIGLELYLDDRDGYAFLRQKTNDEGETGIPRLIQRRPLSFPVSLLCVLLRRKLSEQDASGSESRVILTREQLIEMMHVFLPNAENETRVVDQIDSYLQKLIEYGLLRKLKSNESYEVNRVIRAVVDAEWLGEMNEKLERYRKYANESL